MDLVEEQQQAALEKKSSDKERSSRDSDRRRSRSRDGDRESSSSRRHRSSSRRSDRERSSDRDRDHRSDRDRSERKSRDRGGDRDRDRERDRSDSGRDRKRDREDNGSSPRRRRKRERTGWDQAPDLSGMPMLAAGTPFSALPQHGGPGANPLIAAMMLQQNPNIVRQRRRLYVGNIPPAIFDNDIRQFFDDLMHEKLPQIDPGLCIMDCTINHEKSFAFIELRNPNEATSCLGLDGIEWRGMALKLRRPKDYVMPPTGEDPPVGHITGVISTTVPDTYNKLFIGGLPPALGDHDVRELLGTIGQLRSFNLVKDTTTNASKGFAFCEYEDDATTERAIAALHQMPVADKVLVVQRALQGVTKDMDVMMDPTQFPVIRKGEFVTPSYPAGIFLAPTPLPELLAAIPGTGIQLPSGPVGKQSAEMVLGLVKATEDAGDRARAAAAKLAAAVEAKVAAAATALAEQQKEEAAKVEKNDNDDVEEKKEEDATVTEVKTEEPKEDEKKEEEPVKMEEDAVKQEENTDDANTTNDDSTTVKTEAGDSDAKVEPEANEEPPEDAVEEEPKGLKEQEVARSLPKFDPATSPNATRIVMLLNMVDAEAIVRDEEYFCLMADVKEEADRYGDVEQIRIPRRVEPELNEDPEEAPPGTGRVYIQYKQDDDARKACIGMGGRLFEGRTIIATFYDEAKFANNDLGHIPFSARHKKFTPNAQMAMMSGGAGGRLLQ